MCVCMCVCVATRALVHVCLCVCVCARVYGHRCVVTPPPPLRECSAKLKPVVAGPHTLYTQMEVWVGVGTEVRWVVEVVGGGGGNRCG